MDEGLKYCKFCGEKIHMEAVICPKCGRQIEETKVIITEDTCRVSNISKLVGVLLAFFIPFIGFIVGAVMCVGGGSASKKELGLTMIVTSFIAFGFSFLVLMLMW